MPIRNGEANWHGGKGGTGTVALGSGAFEGSYSVGSRFGDDEGTNPDELVGAAHAACFTMALALALERAGFDPGEIRTSADVHVEKGEDGYEITRIVLETEGSVPEIDEATFRDHAETAKTTCPVSKAMAGTSIELEARLVG